MTTTKTAPGETFPPIALNAAGIRVQLPAGVNPPEPLASTLLLLQDVDARTRAAFRERDLATARQHKAPQLDSRAASDAIVAGTEPPANPHEHEQQAITDLKHAQSSVSALSDARVTLYQRALSELRQVSAEWAASLSASLVQDEADLRQAVAVLEKASVRYTNRLGLLHGVRAGVLASPGHSASVAIQAATHEASSIPASLAGIANETTAVDTILVYRDASQS